MTIKIVYKGYDIEPHPQGVVIKFRGLHKVHPSTAAAKRWLNERNTLPLEKREPFDTPVQINHRNIKNYAII